MSHHTAPEKKKRSGERLKEGRGETGNESEAAGQRNGSVLEKRSTEWLPNTTGIRKEKLQGQKKDGTRSEVVCMCVSVCVRLCVYGGVMKTTEEIDSAFQESGTRSKNNHLFSSVSFIVSVFPHQTGY